MPFIGLIMPGEQGYLGWKWVVNKVEIPYGLFIGEIVNFLIVALALFIFIVKFVGWIMKSKQDGSRRSRPATTADQGPGAVDRNPGPAEKKLKRVTPIRPVIQADTDR